MYAAGLHVFYYMSDVRDKKNKSQSQDTRKTYNFILEYIMGAGKHLDVEYPVNCIMENRNKSKNTIMSFIDNHRKKYAYLSTVS